MLPSFKKAVKPRIPMPLRHYPIPKFFEDRTTALCINDNLYIFRMTTDRRQVIGDYWNVVCGRNTSYMLYILIDSGRASR